jgi:hypothetical protein
MFETRSEYFILLPHSTSFSHALKLVFPIKNIVSARWVDRWYVQPKAVIRLKPSLIIVVKTKLALNSGMMIQFKFEFTHGSGEWRLNWLKIPLPSS